MGKTCSCQKKSNVDSSLYYYGSEEEDVAHARGDEEIEPADKDYPRKNYA